MSCNKYKNFKIKFGIEVKKILILVAIDDVRCCSIKKSLSILKAVTKFRREKQSLTSMLVNRKWGQVNYLINPAYILKYKANCDKTEVGILQSFQLISLQSFGYTSKVQHFIYLTKRGTFAIEPLWIHYFIHLMANKNDYLQYSNTTKFTPGMFNGRCPHKTDLQFNTTLWLVVMFHTLV